MIRYLFTCSIALTSLSACTQGNTSQTACEDNSLQLPEAERQRRISLDFNKTREEILPYIRRYYPNVTDSMLLAWEADGSLEMKMIGGEKRYFSQAARNLFRINPEARIQKSKIDNSQFADGYEKVNEWHLPEVMKDRRSQNSPQGKPVSMEVTYSVTVEKDALQSGDTLRCWLPFPREDVGRQKDIKVLSCTQDNYEIAPTNTLQRSIYMEQVITSPEPITFGYTFSYTSYPEWFDLRTENIRAYDNSSEIYRQYTSERKPHIVFTPQMRALADSVTAGENNPLLKLRRIFDYIYENYPWASAREYSTIPNIPEYVVSQKHGDCGQVSLLLITLCRLSGIPAKWQSGFMMHPGAKNLHDWAEVWMEDYGWVPVDVSFGVPPFAKDEDTHYFYTNGIDAYRWVVNNDYSCSLYPAKRYPRSETVDFQRGEIETQRGNIYFNQWDWKLDIRYLP